MSLFLVKLSWKNVWRNARRTGLTVGSIGVGVTALICIYNYYDAFHQQVIRNVIRYQSGHLVASAPQLISGQMRMLRNPKEVATWLKKQPEVRAFSPRLMLPSLLSSSRGSANVALMGIEPKAEKGITSYAKNIVQGKFLASPISSKNRERKGIVIGIDLARQLKIEVGAKLVAMSQGMDGSIGNELFYLEGIFQTHSDADRSLAFVNIPDARLLIAAPKQAVHQFAIVLDNDELIDVLKVRFAKTFNKKVALLQSWKDLQKPLMAMIDLNRSANKLLMLIILAVAAFGIANSILMSVLERTREFGVMVAVGTAKREVCALVLLETLWLSVCGAVVGNTFGALITWYFGKFGFDLKWLTNSAITVQGMIVQTITYPSMNWEHALRISSAILILSFVIAIIPIRHITRLEPVRALRG